MQILNTEIRIFYLVQKYPNNSIFDTHFEPTPDMEWLIHYPKKENFGIVLVGKFSNILILDLLNFNFRIIFFWLFALLI